MNANDNEPDDLYDVLEPYLHDGAFCAKMTDAGLPCQREELDTKTVCRRHANVYNARLSDLFGSVSDVAQSINQNINSLLSSVGMKREPKPPALLPKTIQTPGDGLGPLQILDDDIDETRDAVKSIYLPKIPDGKFAGLHRLLVVIRIDMAALRIQAQRVEHNRQRRKAKQRTRTLKSARGGVQDTHLPKTAEQQQRAIRPPNRSITIEGDVKREREQARNLRRRNYD